jgi:hypothetical protein
MTWLVVGDTHDVFRVNRNITPTVPARSVDANPDDVLRR